MRTTLDLPENLIKEAMSATQTNTKTAVIIKALEELVQKSKVSELKQFRGKVALDINLNDLRNRHS